MATSVTNTFAGEKFGEIFRLMVEETNTIKNKLVRPLDGVKGARKMQSYFQQIILKSPASTFSASEVNQTIKEKSILPIRLTSEFQVAIQDYQDMWQWSETGRSANDDLATSIQQAIVDQTTSDLSVALDKMIWLGNATTPNSPNLAEFNGLETLWLADTALAVKFTDGGTSPFDSVAITSSNVVAEIDRFYSALPARLKQGLKSGKVAFVLSSTVVDAWKKAMGTNNYQMQSYTANAPLSYLGSFPMMECYGMSAGSMAVYPMEEVIFATASMDDMNRLALKDMREVNLDRIVRIQAEFSGAVGYPISEHIAYYQGK